MKLLKAKKTTQGAGILQKKEDHAFDEQTQEIT